MEQELLAVARHLRSTPVFSRAKFVLWVVNSCLWFLSFFVHFGVFNFVCNISLSIIWNSKEEGSVVSVDGGLHFSVKGGNNVC
jgi:hypothetical protein